MNDFPAPSTPQQKEDERSRQVKCHYASLIQYELQKLNEDQLFKVLVLVKNTVDSLKSQPEVSTQRKPSKNRSLLNPDLIIPDKDNRITKDLTDEREEVTANIYKLGFMFGYGIHGAYGQSVGNRTKVSAYILFCIPNQADFSVEIQQRTDLEGKGKFYYQFTIRDLTEEKEFVSSEVYFSQGTLSAALGKAKNKYSKS